MHFMSHSAVSLEQAIVQAHTVQTDTQPGMGPQQVTDHTIRLG